MDEVLAVPQVAIRIQQIIKGSPGLYQEDEFPIVPLVGKSIGAFKSEPLREEQARPHAQSEELGSKK